jgi:uncharacterized protein with FMN-binding domain
MRGLALLHFFPALCLLTSLISCASAPTTTVGRVEHQKLVDGLYDGSYRKGPVKAVVSVTIKHQRLSSIRLIEHITWKGKEAEAVIPDRIIKEQSTRVDAVTGATISSHVIMHAVQNAKAVKY